MSHPVMRGGHPFKVRYGGRLSQGILINPEMLKFKIPCPIAFVPVNPAKSPRHLRANLVQKKISKTPNLITSGSVVNTPNCQKIVQNYNSCVTNNKNFNNFDKVCQYYRDYLTRNCNFA